MNRKYCKIILILLVCACLAASLFTVPSFASDVPTVTLSESSGEAGSEFTVEIGYSCDRIVTGSEIRVTYDANLTYVSGEKINADTINQKNGTVTVLQAEGDTKSGSVASLKFKVNDGVKDGTALNIKAVLVSYSDDEWNEYTVDSEVSKTYTVKAAATPTPTQEPTPTPTQEPTATPTKEPTATPTKEPTATPTKEPTPTPTKVPTSTPTAKPTPTKAPTERPTEGHTEGSTERPTERPSEEPTSAGTEEPTGEIPEDPTDGPEDIPTDVPADSSADPRIAGTPDPDTVTMRSGSVVFWMLLSVVIGIWVGIGIGYLIWGRNRGYKVRRSKVIGNDDN